MRTTRASTLCLSALLLALGPAVVMGQKPSDAAHSVELVAKTLERFNESVLADRFRADFATNRVRFDETEAGTNASVTGTGGPETNVLHLPPSMAELHKRVKPDRPYNPNSSVDLVGLSLTLVHEYVHMDQQNPDMTPEFEDPAWRKTEEALVRWSGKIAGELDMAATASKSPDRTAKLQELADLLRLLRSASGSLDVGAVQGGAVPGWGEWVGSLFQAHNFLTPGQSWQFGSTTHWIEQMLRRIQEVEPGIVPDDLLPDVKVPAGGAWVQTRVGVWSDNPTLQNYIDEARVGPYQVNQVVAPGVVRVHSVNPFLEGAPVDSMEIRWSVPAMVSPGEPLKFTATGRDTGSTLTPRGSFVQCEPSIYMSSNMTDWSGHAINRGALVHTAGQEAQTKTWELPTPAKGAATVFSLHLSAGSGFWGKYVDYWYEWRD